MRKIYILIFSFLAFTKISIGQTYTWNGSSSTDFQIAVNWTPLRTTPGTTDILSFNVASAVVVTNVPNQTIGAIQVAGGTGSVTFTTNNPLNILNLTAAVPLIFTSAGSILSGDILTIQLNNAAPFTISSGTFGISPSTGGKIAISGSLIIAGGKLDLDVTGTGGTTINGTGSITYTSGIFTCLTAAAITWTANSNYYHNVAGSGANAIPAASWQTGSSCNITGMNAGTTAPTGFTGIDFANFSWNCTAQINNVDLLPAGSVVNVNGTLTIANTNAKELRLAAAGKATVKAGNFMQTGGTLTLQASASPDTTTLGVTGSFSHTAGILNGVGGTSPGTALIDLQGPVSRGAGATWQTNNNALSNMVFQFSGIASQTVNVAAGSWNTSQGRCSIINNNGDITTGIILTGMLRVYNNTSALPATFTMNGVVTGSGGVSYTGAGSGGTTLIYSGSFFQVASALEFPLTNGPLNLTLNNILGVNFPGGFSRTIDGRLTMSSGNLAIGAGNILTLNNSVLGSQLTYTGGFITTGTLGRTFPITGLPTDTSDTRSLFPFGSGTNNRGLRVFFSSSNLSSGTSGIIYVAHSPVVGVSPISPTIFDNGINLDKKTASNWDITTGAFSLGGGGETISLTVVAGNIGSVDDYTKLRLTDGVTGYGNLINTNTGTNSVPATGKSGLLMTDLNKPLYIGSDGTTLYNPLVIITFNWTGLGGNTAWANPGNWTGVGAVGYPSASTEIAIITSTSGTQPTINASDNISVFQLTVGGGMTVTMVGNAVINVYDNANFSGGSASFATSSTFGYASSNNPQNLLTLPYGNLSVSGTAAKNLPAAITVTGNYTISGSTPVFTNNVFTYAGTGAQRIAATNYDNLTITGNRGGGLISLGNGTSANIIDIKSVFNISSLSNFTSKVDFNTINFSSTGSQNIPGFTYGIITQSNLGPRVFDPLGSADPAHVIICRALTQPGASTLYTVTGSKVRFVASGTVNTNYGTAIYNDMELSGDLKQYILDFTPTASITILGTFSVTATNFKLATKPFRLNFNGTTGTQTIPAFKYNNATNTPSFKYNNVSIAGGSRNVTLAGDGSDTIAITGNLIVENLNGTANPFAGANGFNVGTSTVEFDSSSFLIPVLKPVSGVINYNNIYVSSGTRILAGNMTIGGNVTVSGTDAAPATLTVGNGGNPLPAPPTRIVNVLGNMNISGSGAGTKTTGQLDLNTGTYGKTIVNLAGNLSIGGRGQIMGTTSDNASNGLVTFNGATQTYSNTSNFKDSLVNYTIGDGVSATTVTLISSMNLVTSSLLPNPNPNRDTLTIAAYASLNVGTNNIFTTGSSTMFVSLQSDATLITSNQGGIEGTATNGSNGSIRTGATIVKLYNDNASYTFNGVTSTPFSTGVPNNRMANLTIGANVNLDKSIQLSRTFTMSNPVNFGLTNADLTLRSTASTTARVAPVPGAAAINYGTGRFIVERFYPADRSWRLVTSPLSSNGTPTTIFDQWQNNGVYTPGAGAFVTGPNPNTATNGLDYSDMNNYSLKTYQNNAYVNIGNTLAPLSNSTTTAANIGYFMFVRGDRSRTPDNTIIPNSNTTTLTSRGKIQYGTQNFPGVTRTVPGSERLFTLVGNPYASPVDFNTITRNNIVKRFIVWDPKLNVVGGFITFDDLDGDGTYSQSVFSPGGQDVNIQSSQAFFVETDASVAGSSITFQESCKSTVNNLTMFRPLTPAVLTSSLKSSLLLVNADNSTVLADGNLAQFNDNLNSAVDVQDALKIANVNETFGLLRSGTPIAMERRKTISEDDTLYLYLARTTKRNYRFEFEPTNMDPLLTAFLEDSYTSTKTPLNLSSTTGYDFKVNSDTKSAVSNRFKIVFKARAAGPLPVTYSNIKAYQKNTDIAVEWTVENEISISKYEVEKSIDGVNFSKVNTTIARGTNSGTTTYEFVDGKASRGNNFYRIASYSMTGAVEYSRVVVVKIGKVATGISIYPNPVKGNTVGVSFNNIEEGVYGVRLINLMGQTLVAKQIVHSSGSSMETVSSRTHLSTGIYQLEVTAPDKQISTIKVIVQ